MFYNSNDFFSGFPFVNVSIHGMWMSQNVINRHSFAWMSQCVKLNVYLPKNKKKLILNEHDYVCINALPRVAFVLFKISRAYYCACAKFRGQF